MSTIDGISMEGSKKHDGENLEDETSNDIPQQRTGPPVQIIRYSTATLFALRSSKLSQQKPACKNMDLSCMIHIKIPPKMLIANMMPKFALNQMPSRGEESISPLSFHSNSSSSSNLSYQKRYQDGNNGSAGDGYTNNRYYYNKYKSNEDGNSSRIIYKTTGANASNGNSIRFLKKAYNSKYEEHNNSIGLISNKNILDNASRVITAADHRNSKKKFEENVNNENNKSKTISIDGKSSNESIEKKMPPDEANNNSEKNKNDSIKLTEVNANDLMMRNDLKKLPNDMDITNHLDDIFNDLNINQLLDDNIPDERESSRFSKWFKTNEVEAKEEQFPDAQNNNNTNKNQNLSLFSHETEKFFQPIEKVENNSLFQMMKGRETERHRNDPLMNMLKHQPTAPPASALSPNSGQVHSVEELEAKLRHHNDDKDRKSNESEKKALQNFFQQQLIPNLMPQQQQQQQQQQQRQHHLNQQQNQDDINAFKKLLSQITNDNEKSPNQLPTTPNNQNMLQQLINKGLPNNPDVMTQYQKSFQTAGKGQQMNSQKIMNPLNTGNHMMQQQYSNNMDLKFLQQQQQQQQQQKVAIPEIIKRPEVQTLVQELTSGDISQYTLWQRLTAPGLSPIEREIITCALNLFNASSNNGNSAIFPKQPIGPAPNLYPQNAPIGPSQNTSQALHQLMQHQMKSNSLTAPIPIPPQTSPLSPVPPIEQHLLYQHQAAVAANKQLRLSPLPAGIPQRIPSPRELQYHTQSIMQNALIRKKLEEQRENFRKRQEQEKQDIAKKSHSDSTSTASVESTSDQQNVVVTTMAPSQDEASKNIIESPTKKVAPSISQPQAQRHHASSPSIFTPTSVLRKMTAEKESDSGKSSANAIRMEDKKKQAQSMQQHAIRNQMQQPFMNNMNMPPMDRIKMQNEAFSMHGWDSHQQQLQGIKPPGRPIVKSSSQPSGIIGNQQNNINQGGSAIIPPNSMNFDIQQQQQMQKLNQIQKAQFIQQQQQMMQMKKQQMDNNPVLSQFMAQQQQRAQAQSQFRSQFQQQQSMNFPSMMQGRTEKGEDLLDNRNIMNNGGCLSPTSNQLAKWFSPELLADASAGKLLPSLNVGQMMSLEELEKCMQNS